jgi:hypothetical protein
MPTRTAPAFTDAATARIITLRLIDASGDLFAESVEVPVAATAASIEELAAAYATATNASLYSSVDTQERSGARLPTNATAAYRGVVESGINLLLSVAATGVSVTQRLIAPIANVLDGNKDIPLPASTELAAVTAKIVAIKTGFVFQQAQYTTRRERRNNSRVR